MTKVHSRCIVEIERLHAQYEGKVVWLSTAHRDCCDEVEQTTWDVSPSLEDVLRPVINHRCPHCGRVQSALLYLERHRDGDITKVTRDALLANGIEVAFRNPNVPSRAHRRMTRFLAENALSEGLAEG